MATILGLPQIAPDPERTEQGDETFATLGSYRLLSLLGEGGAGRVYLAKHLVSGSMVAVKVLRPELTIDRSAVRRFIAEARTVSQLGHPGVVRVVDVALPGDNGPLFFAMEYLAGIDLKREMQSGSMPLLRAVEIGLQICDVLQAVHEAGIIHRDLKPANIYLVRVGERDDVVKILDFGLAKLERPTSDGASTTTGHLVGTPAYMSPEQAGGDRIDRRSDLYSLGVILYEMFTAPGASSRRLRSRSRSVRCSRGAPDPPRSPDRSPRRRSRRCGAGSSSCSRSSPGCSSPRALASPGFTAPIRCHRPSLRSPRGASRLLLDRLRR
jgi:serine/threonine protein kinase